MAAARAAEAAPKATAAAAATSVELTCSSASLEARKCLGALPFALPFGVWPFGALPFDELAACSLKQSELILPLASETALLISAPRPRPERRPYHHPRRT